MCCCKNKTSIFSCGENYKMSQFHLKLHYPVPKPTLTPTWSFQCLTFALQPSTMISLPLSHTPPFSHRHSASPPPPPPPPPPSPSEDKLWLGPDIPSNLLSQHRVKRARVLQRKPLYATAAVPEETWHTTAQGCHAGNHLKKNKSINIKYVCKYKVNIINIS